MPKSSLADVPVPILEEVRELIAPSPKKKAAAWEPAWETPSGEPMSKHLEAGLNLAAECHRHALAARLGFVGKA